MKKTREELIEVYKDTRRVIERGDLGLINMGSMKMTYGVDEESPSNIKVVDCDSVTALFEEDAIRYRERICVLNMASAKKPGGGVERGEPTQEECLYRCSNLSQHNLDIYYPLKDNEFMYQQDVVFFKDAEYEILDEDHWVEADVISFPAINLNPNSYFDKEQQKWIDGLIEKPIDYDAQLKAKIRALFDAAIQRNVDIMILGAWGCGVFKNDPTDVAYAFRDVLIEEEYSKQFQSVVFPVINDENSTNNNYYYFEKILNNL